MAASVADVAGAVRKRLQSRESARCVASVRHRLAERQSTQVDGSDVGAPQRSRHVSGLPAFHYACAMGGRGSVEATAHRGARAQRCADSRWHKFPETGDGLGRCGAAVLRRAREDRQLPGGGHRGAVDRYASVAAGSGVVSARRMAHAHAASAGPDSGDGARSRRNGNWR